MVSKSFVVFLAHDKISELYDVLDKQKPEYIIIKKISNNGFNTYCFIAGLLKKIKEMRQSQYYDDLTIRGFLHLHEKDDTGTITDNQLKNTVSENISKNIRKRTPTTIENEKQTVGVLDHQKGKTNAAYQFQDVVWSNKIRRIRSPPTTFVTPPTFVSPPPFQSSTTTEPITDEETKKTLKKIITGNIPYLKVGKDEEFEIKLIDIMSSRNAMYDSEATIDVTDIPEYVDDIKAIVSVLCYPPEIVEIKGERDFEISVPLDCKDSTPAKYTISPKMEGKCTISGRIFLKGTNKEIGTIVMDPYISSGDFQGEHYYTGKADFTKSAEPDLIITIVPSGSSSFERYTDDAFSYTIAVDAPKFRLKNKEFGKHTIEKPQEYFDEEFLKIEKIRPSADPVKASDDLTSFGISLWKKMIPDDFKEWFWKNQNEFHSIQIFSPEPWIPWEIMKPNKDGNIGEFLCEKYDFSRWIAGKSMPYPPIISNINVILPKSDLPLAKKESELIESYEQEWATNVDIVSTYKDLKKSLQPKNNIAPEIDIVHFIGHGHSRGRGDDSYIKLGKEKFKAENMSLFYFEEPHNPLIILNACQTGRSGYSLSGSDGWAHRCIEQEAYAFIGTFWNVSDRCALEFSTWLYHYIDKKINLDEAVKLARRKAKDGTKPGDPSWMAYCLYSPPQEMIRVGK